MEYKILLLHLILKHFKVSNRSQVACQFGGIVCASKEMIIMKEEELGKQQSKLENGP